MLVRGFAALKFPESAGISLARAVERAFADPTVDYPEAWIVEERSIEFSLSAELDLAQVGAHKRLLEELLREAAEGEAYLDVDGVRWDPRLLSSGVPGREVSGHAVDEDDILETIRARSG